jgi:hypothetical protein
MSTPPRDAGIPMLTEVIEEEGMDFVGPPPPDEANAIAAAEAVPVLPAPGPQPEIAPEPEPAVAETPPQARNDYAPQGVGIQYGSAAQFAPSYPLPLKPAASSAPPATAETSMAGRAAGPLAANAPLPAPMSEDEWQRMERRVRERILGQLLSRTDAMLEERIHNSVAGVLEQAVDGLAATLRASLHKTLEDVVSRAVAQEISRLQSTKK